MAGALDPKVRSDSVALLARQPWARVSKELALYARRRGPEGAAPRHAVATARAAIGRASDPAAPPWNFRETNLWTLLTSTVDELLSSDGGPVAIESAASERDRIPLLDNVQLDAELLENGLDPGALSRDGMRLRDELRGRVATSTQPARTPAAASPPPRTATAARSRRPELPTLSTGGWLALATVVLATVVLAALAVLWARR